MLKHETINGSRLNKNERGISQRRNWEHQIRNEHGLNTRIDYIHYNPVKHGHVTLLADWLNSSIHQHIRNGFASKDWGSSEAFEGGFGERRDLQRTQMSVGCRLWLDPTYRSIFVDRVELIDTQQFSSPQA